MDGAFNYELFTVIWNLKQPLITTKARVVGKRQDNNGIFTYYYITFASSDGSNYEFSLPEEEYNLLTQGDTGQLSTQGTSYQRFIKEFCSQGFSSQRKD